MTELVVPDVRWHASWAATMLEFGTEFPHGSGLTDPPPAYDEAGCAAFAAVLRGAEDEPLREDWVRCTFRWVVEDGPGGREVVGFLALRHELNDWLLHEGGHIGYSVRPSRRREGIASRTLGLGLLRAGRRGLERVLLTCDEDNVGSRRTIESHGGVYEDSRNGKRRYWIDTPAPGDEEPDAQASGR